MQIHTHALIAKTAKEMAEALFEEVMKDNERYKTWKAICPDLSVEELRKRYVKLAWPKLVDQARATLTQMLGTNIAESLKDQIADALIKDNALIRSRRSAVRSLRPPHFH